MNHPIPNNLRKIAAFLRLLEETTHHLKHRRDLVICANYLERTADHYQRLEVQMGRTADAIGKLEQALAASRADASHLKSQLDAANTELANAQANALDAADLAALDTVDTAVGTTTTDTTAGGTGIDTTVGGGGTPPTP